MSGNTAGTGNGKGGSNAGAPGQVFQYATTATSAASLLNIPTVAKKATGTLGLAGKAMTMGPSVVGLKPMGIKPSGSIGNAIVFNKKPAESKCKRILGIVLLTECEWADLVYSDCL